MVKHTKIFTQESLNPRPAEEIARLAAQKIRYLGLQIPYQELAKAWYVGDGKHYRVVRPDGEKLFPTDLEAAEKQREKNQKCWNEEVDVSGATYSKPSWKPGTKNRVCIAHQAFYDLTGLCIGFTWWSWCGAPDKVQLRHEINHLEAFLWWDATGKPLGVGLLDGGYLDRELCQRLGIVIPTPENVLSALQTVQQPFVKEVRIKFKVNTLIFTQKQINEFIRVLRGPGAEARFADQVHHFAVLSDPWRLSLDDHDSFYGICEELLNWKRRQQMGEEIPFSDKEAMASPFFCYAVTLLDDLLQDGEIREGPTAVFEWVGEENLPSSLAGILFPTHYLEVTSAPTCSRRREIVRNNEKEKQQERRRHQKKETEKGKEKESDDESESDQDELVWVQRKLWSRMMQFMQRGAEGREEEAKSHCV